MRLRPTVFLFLFIAGAALAQAPAAVPQLGSKKAEALKGYDPAGGAGKTVHELPIEGTIDLGLASFVERVVKDAQPGDRVVLRIKTFGGRVDGAVRIRDALLKSRATTIAFVDQRAISAGALISLACDTIIMSDGSTIGDAMPIELSGGGADGQSAKTSEKAISYFRAEMRATAQAKGRRGDLAEAMVDPDIEIKGITAKGKILTLTSSQALALGMADAVVPGYDDAFELLNLTQASRIAADTDWGEKIARALTDPVVSSLLMTFGFLGLLMEMYTPGFGAPGIIGITCLLLFFFGQYSANLAGWEELLLFGIGAVLLIIELLFIPGFGVAGVAGIGLMAVAVVMAFVELELPWDTSFELGYVAEAAEMAATRLAILIVALAVGAWVFSKYLPGTRLGRGVILEAATTAALGYVSQSAAELQLAGKRGRALGSLRPAGIADIEGRRVDVVTQGDFIEAGSDIEVTLVDGNRVVVKKV